MGGTTGSMSFLQILNAIGNLMISQAGAGICVLALAFAFYQYMWGEGRPGRTVVGVIALYCVGWLLAEVTGTANPLGAVF